MNDKNRTLIAIGATLITMIAGFWFGYFIFVIVM